MNTLSFITEQDQEESPLKQCLSPTQIVAQLPNLQFPHPIKEGQTEVKWSLKLTEEDETLLIDGIDDHGQQSESQTEFCANASVDMKPELDSNVCNKPPTMQ